MVQGRLKIFGCEYRVPKKSLENFLGHYGELVSEIVEELFEDGLAATPGPEDETGTNEGFFLGTFQDLLLGSFS